jgi:hypothetical protein
VRVFLICIVVAAVAGVFAPRAPAASAGWVRPVAGPVLRVFAVGGDRFAAGQHRGVDLEAPPGARVGAACGGRVSFAGVVPRGGRTVSVRCGRLVATLQHLGAVAVRRGQIVLPGARIGAAGHARPRPHVHLGARAVATGAYVDPLTLLGGGAGVQRPPVPGARRSPPLGPAPPGRAPVSAPGAQRVRVLQRRAAPAERVAPQAVPLPWPVWLGLGLFGLGLPLGGFVTVRARRRHAPAPLARTAS